MVKKKKNYEWFYYTVCNKLAVKVQSFKQTLEIDFCPNSLSYCSIKVEKLGSNEGVDDFQAYHEFFIWVAVLRKNFYSGAQAVFQQAFLLTFRVLMSAES